MNRKPIVVGNWKMHCNRQETRALLQALGERVGSVDAVDVGAAPPFTSLESAAAAVSDNQILLVAQNMHHAPKGAFTGEISASMLVELGVDFVILGHSERRHVFQESDETINLKVKSALENGLGVILCIGETLEERNAGATVDRVSAQVAAGLEGVDAAQMKHVVLAYEPVWAIGTGLTATPDQAQDVHAALRALLKARFSEEIAAQTRIMYGGSVKPANAAELLAQRDIDGALVGGASLKAESFEGIIKAAL